MVSTRILIPGFHIMMIERLECMCNQYILQILRECSTDIDDLIFSLEAIDDEDSFTEELLEWLDEVSSALECAIEFVMCDD